MRSPSVACLAVARNAAPSASSSNAAKGNTSTAPWNQKNAATAKDSALNPANTHASWAGATEQLRRKDHYHPVSDTEANWHPSLTGFNIHHLKKAAPDRSHTRWRWEYAQKFLTIVNCSEVKPGFS